MAKVKKETQGLDKQHYQVLMAEHLSELRNILGISQSVLADYIGTTRQTINSIENKKRPMMWDTFMSLVLLFISNEETKKQMAQYDMNPQKITEFLSVNKTKT